MALMSIMNIPSYQECMDLLYHKISKDDKIYLNDQNNVSLSEYFIQLDGSHNAKPPISLANHKDTCSPGI